VFTQQQIEQLVDLLVTLDHNTRIYIGTDSVKFVKDGRQYAKYATVCVVHRNGKNGCTVFKHRSIEPDYDLKKNRPKIRLLNEVRKSCELYIQLAPFIDCFESEIHLDINLDERHGSNCAAQEAAGYVLGMTGLPDEYIKFKPDAVAASFCGDHFAHNQDQ
jgi:uncharacterized protein